MHQELHVNVIDTRTPASAIRAAEREARNGPTENLSVTQQWSMDRICRRILERANQQGGGLGVVRLISHGNSGFVQLGSGLTSQSVRDFQLLRGRFVGRYPKIEVHACGVLSGQPVTLARPTGTIDLSSAGQALMQSLANAAQVLVIAAYDVQDADGRMRFEGPIRHFRPRGG
ncbi:hypothetical protein [Thiorhodococcus minor]|uniref:Uncharacterized protein n=1 Tax=Thiorhodococcus minor TaxID=57489 RepID=A0A6M0K1T7_9GAMM|nr:hypothetical protein [Thiorhodococcus minor]NEV63718.1 hypothetical protein [Thiorhodococcus minor]